MCVYQVYSKPVTLRYENLSQIIVNHRKSHPTD